MNEVEDGSQLGAALQRRAAALLPAHYSASSRSQRLDLGTTPSSAFSCYKETVLPVFGR